MHRPTSNLCSRPILLSAFLVAYSTAIALADLPSAAYVGMNLALAAGLATSAIAERMTLREVGLSRSSVGPGLRWGGAIAGLVAAGLGVGLLVLGDRFPSGTMKGVGTAGLLIRILLRVPFGTALPEEVLFRGVLFAAWTRARSVRTAVAASAVTFGLWHVGPTISTLHTTGHAVSLGPIIGAVAFTTLAGVVLAWGRVRTGGVWGPALVHWAANSFVLTAGWASLRLA